MHADTQVLNELGLLFGAAVALAMLGARFRIPAVLAYVFAGVVLGPPGFGLLAESQALELLAEVGVILLLFTIGLEFDLGTLARAWRAILLGGGLQVGGTTLVVAAVASVLGAAPGAAITWGFLVALSSTAVVLRLIEDRGETLAPHGRLATGVLIFQDLCIVPMMMVLPALAGDGDGVGSVFMLGVRAIGVVALVLLLSRRIVPPLMGIVARQGNREVFLLAVLAVGGLVAWAVSLTGLSFALGGFLAGVVLADTQFSHQAMADVLPLRAVMMCVFFVGIGMLLDLDAVAAQPGLVFGLFFAIVVAKSAIAAAAFVLLRFPVTVAAIAAASLAQVGEFSLVLAGAAREVGLLSVDQERAFLAAAILTIAVTPLVVTRSPAVVSHSRALRAASRLLDGREAPDIVTGTAPTSPHVIVAGLGVGGRTLVDALERVDIPVTIIELNPDTVSQQRALGRHVVYGDIRADEVLRHAGLATARAVVLAISRHDLEEEAVERIHALRPDVTIVVRTRFASDEGSLRARGLDVVSEEFAGAVTMAGLVLRRLGVSSWDDHVSALLDEHETLGVGDEGHLGPPPEQHLAATRLSRPRDTPPGA